MNENQAREQLGQVGAMFGQQAVPLPAHLRDMVRNAEQMKRNFKGIGETRNGR